MLQKKLDDSKSLIEISQRCFHDFLRANIEKEKGRGEGKGERGKGKGERGKGKGERGKGRGERGEGRGERG